MSRRYGKNDSYCDITVREKGIATHSELTLEIQFSFSSRWREFTEGLKEKLPRRAWHFDDTVEPKVWRVSPRYQLVIENLAKEFFDCARRIEGAVTTDLKTGSSVEQKGLF